MTQEDKNLLLKDLCGRATSGMDRMPKLIDWLNKHHFDYRGLIEKSLAIEAPDGMYKVNEK